MYPGWPIAEIEIRHDQTSLENAEWRPLGESNPCCQDENLESSASRRRGLERKRRIL